MTLNYLGTQLILGVVYTRKLRGGLNQEIISCFTLIRSQESEWAVLCPQFCAVKKLVQPASSVSGFYGACNHKTFVKENLQQGGLSDFPRASSNQVNKINSDFLNYVNKFMQSLENSITVCHPYSKQKHFAIFTMCFTLFQKKMLTIVEIL